MRLIGLNACTLIVAAIGLLLRTPVDVWWLMGAFWATSLAGMAGVRAILLSYGGYLQPKLRPSRNLVIVGSGARAREVYLEFKAHSEWEYRLIGFVDSEPQNDFVPAELVLGGIDDLETILMHTVVDEVVIALPIKSQYEAVEYAIGICQSLGIQAQYFTDFFSTSITKRHSPGGDSSVVLEVVHDDYRKYIKRGIDVALSATLLVIFFPSDADGGDCGEADEPGVRCCSGRNGLG